MLSDEFIDRAARNFALTPGMRMQRFARAIESEVTQASEPVDLVAIHARITGQPLYLDSQQPAPCPRCSELSVDVWEQKRCQDAMEATLTAHKEVLKKLATAIKRQPYTMDKEVCDALASIKALEGEKEC